MSAPPLFDTVLARHRLRRAMASGGADFLLKRAIEDLHERVAVVQRRFMHIADVGTALPTLAQGLRRDYPDALVARIAPLTETGAILGEAERLPLRSGTFDLVVSALALHGANDLPGALAQMRRALKPDGLLLANLPGGRTLHELRAVLTEAEVATSGGGSPRVSPFADVRDMGGLLQRAGLALPVADSETIVVRYPNLFALMADLRAMGATNTLLDRTRRPTKRALFAEAARRYGQRFADADGRIRATFELVSISGWAPHDSQQKPAARGSATISLAAALARSPNGGTEPQP